MLRGLCGIDVVVLFPAARGTREFVLRIALAASLFTLLAYIVRDALILVAIGLVVGLAGALALTRTLEGLLFAVTPADPATLVAVITTLGLTAVLASLWPAWRAAAIDPLAALRAE